MPGRLRNSKAQIRIMVSSRESQRRIVALDRLVWDELKRLAPKPFGVGGS